MQTCIFESDIDGRRRLKDLGAASMPAECEQTLLPRQIEGVVNDLKRGSEKMAQKLDAQHAEIVELKAMLLYGS